MKANENTRGRTARDRFARRTLKTARVLTIYGLLLGGSAVFALPFAWMLGTSFKVDREMFGSRITIWPMRPVPAARSPYVDRRYFARPQTPAYETIRPVICDALSAVPLPFPAYTEGLNTAIDTLAPGLFGRLQDRMPIAAWRKPAAELNAMVHAAVTSELVEETANKVYRHLTFGQVRVRSMDLQEVDVTQGRPLSQFWEIDAQTPARLVDLDNAPTEQADLVYDFGLHKDAEIRLARTLKLPFSVERLFRVQIYVRPDDSWHPVQFYVEKNGVRYRGERCEYLANCQWTSVTLQDFVQAGEDPPPDLSKIRLWIPMKEVDRDPRFESRPDSIRIEMVMVRNSSLGAWWAKCKRNYRGALDYIPFWRYASTSAFLVVLNVIGTVFSCSLVAFAFARLQWPGRNFCFGLMLATMMIPAQVTMIPYFLIMKHLGWYNTLNPLWIVSFFGNAFNIFLLRQFMKGIPRDMEDAARIDGCNFLQVYWFVIMPLIKPTLACIAIFTFMGVWNDFMGPLIFLADQRLYPLSLGLYAFNVQQGGDFGMMMAGSLLMTLPVIVIFFFAQKYFIQGITLTGAKG